MGHMRWVTAAALILFIGACSAPETPTKMASARTRLTLAEARRHHQTNLLKHGPAPQEFDNATPQGVVERVTYHSAGRELFAWLVKLYRSSAGPRPAVLHAHAGFALGTRDLKAVQPFVDAGFIVLLPTWRAENGNTGDFEMFYGEVEDALAALDFLAARPDVDPGRLYVSGESAGGNIALLLAESSRNVRGAAACGAFPDLRGHVETTGERPLDEAPFNSFDELETDLRSPARHLRDLHCPAALFYGEHDHQVYIRQAQQMESEARKLHKAVSLEIIPGAGHQNAWDPAAAKMVKFFQSLDNDTIQRTGPRQ